MKHPFAIFVPMGNIPIEVALIFAPPSKCIAVNADKFYNDPQKG